MKNWKKKKMPSEASRAGFRSLSNLALLAIAVIILAEHMT